MNKFILKYKDLSISIEERVKKSYYYVPYNDVFELDKYIIQTSIFGFKFSSPLSIDIVDSSGKYYNSCVFDFITSFGFLNDDDNNFNSDTLSYGFKSSSLSSFLILNKKDPEFLHCSLNDLKTLIDINLTKFELDFLCHDNIINNKEELFLKNIYTQISQNKKLFAETTLNSLNLESLHILKNSLSEYCSHIFNNFSNLTDFNLNNIIFDKPTSEIFNILYEITQLDIYKKQFELINKYNSINNKIKI